MAEASTITDPATVLEVFSCGGNGLDDRAVADTERPHGGDVVEPIVDAAGCQRASQRLFGQVGNVQAGGLGFCCEVVRKVHVDSSHAGYISPRVPMLMAIRNKLAAGLREDQ